MCLPYYLLQKIIDGQVLKESSSLTLYAFSHHTHRTDGDTTTHKLWTVRTLRDDNRTCDNVRQFHRCSCKAQKNQRFRFLPAATVSTVYSVSSCTLRRLRMSSRKGTLRNSGMSLRFHAKR